MGEIARRYASRSETKELLEREISDEIVDSSNAAPEQAYAGLSKCLQGLVLEEKSEWNYLLADLLGEKDFKLRPSELEYVEVLEVF